jgi:ACS family tartrate transporter-like MFS transporter
MAPPLDALAMFADAIGIGNKRAAAALRYVGFAADRLQTMSSFTGLPASPAIDDRQTLSGVTLRKVTRRLIPFLFVLYIVAWLDRVNVGFAALQMNSDLGFSSAAFGFGAGIFFAGYCLFEVPSNIILHRMGARLWIARIMVTWGFISSAMMFVKTPASFYVLRFLLGVAEAGFFPGIIYYLTLWYPAEQRARAIAAFMMAIPVTGLIGGPLSGVLLGLHGVYGLAGWQWLFLLEGLPAILLGFIALVWLTDRPESARWLAPPERNWLVQRLAAERTACVAAHPIGTLAALANATVWRLGMTFLLVAIGFYGYSFWSPLVIKSLTGIGDLGVGLISGAISAATIVCMLLNSAHSDRHDERPMHVAIPLLIMAAGFLGSALLRTPALAILCLALVPLGHCAAYGPFWSMPSRFLTGEAMAGGIALIAAIANLGGFIGPTLIGVLKDRTGTHVAAFLLLGGFAAIGSLLALQLRSAAALNTARTASRTASG